MATTRRMRADRLTEAQRNELWNLMSVPERESWLRVNATPAERELRTILDADPRTVGKFKFQAHCCGFYADFLFPAPAKLIVELDGSVHAGRSAKIADARRTRELARAGYTVIRFWNSQVRTEPDHIKAKILAALGYAPAVVVAPRQPTLDDVVIPARAVRRKVAR